MNLADALRERLPGAHILEGEPMAPHTTMRVGGPAQCLLDAASPREVSAALACVRELGAPVTVIGNGSNLIVRDGGIRGLVLRIAERMTGVEFDGAAVEAQAGAQIAAVARACAERGLSGLEFAAGIPGTVGGAVCMNAGAYGGEIAQVTTGVRALDMEGGELTLEGGALDFGYRASVLRKRGLVLLSARMALERGEPAAIKALCAELNARRRERQPLNMPSAGSVFKRPPGDYAGRLIEAAGLKGLAVGGARVSEKHANFIINAGGATAQDVLLLIDAVKTRVYQASGVMLEEEVCVIGSDAI